MNIIQKIKESKKKTLVRVYLNEEFKELKSYSYSVIGEWEKIKEVLTNHKVKGSRKDLYFVLPLYQIFYFLIVCFQ